MASCKKTFIKIIFFILFCVPFVSCVQNTTNLNSTDFKIYFSYEDEKSYPKASVCVLTETNSNPRLLKEIQIISKSDGYIWNLDDIKKVEIFGGNYVCCTNIVVPDGKEFQEGSYEIKYKTYTDDETVIDYNFTFNKELYKIKSSETPVLENDELTKNLVIYNDDNKVIYYGYKNDQNSSSDLVKINYKDAAYYNEVWLLPSGKEIIVFPEVPVKSDSE